MNNNIDNDDEAKRRTPNVSDANRDGRGDRSKSIQMKEEPARLSFVYQDLWLKPRSVKI